MNSETGLSECNLAIALGDDEQFEESEAAVRQAFDKGLDAPECWLTLARALVGLGRFGEAENAFREAIVRRPIYPSAHSELAQLIWMQSGDIKEASKTLDALISARPDDMDFRLVKAKLLEYIDPKAAYSILAEALKNGSNDLRISICASQLSMILDPANALRLARQAFNFAPYNPLVLATVCQACLASGHPEQASAAADVLRQISPKDQSALALQATAWRALGDPRYQELYDYDKFLREWTIETPAGWPSLRAYLSDLTQKITGLHRLRAPPMGLSLRGGSQTTQRLDRIRDPVVQAFFKAIDQPIRQHIAGTGNINYRLNGAWSAKLEPGGHHTNHIHPLGWLSSACYIALPKAIERGSEGWIKFGEPGIPTQPKLDAERYLKPAEGKLILFPSYMWHGTVPFAGHEPRLAIAFDIIPA